MVMFGVLLLIFVVVWLCRGMKRLVVLSCLVWWVVLECCVVGEFLGGVERVPLNRKTPAHLAGYGRDGGFQVSAKGLEETELLGIPGGARAPPLHQGDEALGPLDRAGVGWGIWGYTGPRLQALHD